MDRFKLGALLLVLTACGVDAVGAAKNGEPSDDPVTGGSNGAHPGSSNTPGTSDEGGSVGVGDGGAGGTDGMPDAAPPPPPPPPPTPASCAEAPSVKNTTTTLYVGKDPNKPWKAYCGGAGETYLVLPAGPLANWSIYPSGGCAESQGPAWIRTTWTRVRIDPATFVVTTNDFSGAGHIGDTHEVSGNGTIDFHYRSMPFAMGRTCQKDDSQIVARVDLTQTPFRVAANNAYLTEGFQGEGQNDLKSNGAVLELKVKGFPAGIHACPNGDYYQKVGGACLKLVYANP